MSAKNGMSVSKPKKPRKHLGNPFSLQWPDKGGTKLIGAYISQHDADYLSLLAIYKSSTASDLMRQAIQDMIKKCIDAGESEDFIIQVMVKRALEEWEYRLQINNGEYGWRDRIDLNMKFEKYQDELKQHLLKRKIPVKFITRIRNKLQSAYDSRG